jgi:hypothetical protein
VANSVNDWAEEILKPGYGAREAAIAIMMGLQGPDPSARAQGLISRCGRNIVTGVQNMQAALPFDDRLWFGTMTALVTMYVTWQTRALQLIREARHWRAVQLYKVALNHSIATTCGGVLNASCSVWTPESLQPDPEQLCNSATDPDLALNSTNPVLVARSECNDLKADETRFQQWILSHYIDAGVPLSTGDRPGDGLRLVLGTDILVSDTVKKDQNVRVLETRYLVPASLAAFDPRCQGSTVAELASQGCSVLGGPEDDNTRWTDTPYRLGHPSRTWKPAGVDVWGTLRYSLNVSKIYAKGAAGGDASSLLVWMDRGFEAGGHVAFANMTNLTFWIHSHKFYANLVDDIDLKARADIRPDYGRDPNRYWINAQHGFYNIRGFVNRNATDKRSGPTDVVMYGRDMAAVRGRRGGRVWRDPPLPLGNSPDTTPLLYLITSRSSAASAKYWSKTTLCALRAMKTPTRLRCRARCAPSRGLRASSPTRREPPPSQSRCSVRRCVVWRDGCLWRGRRGRPGTRHGARVGVVSVERARATTPTNAFPSLPFPPHTVSVRVEHKDWRLDWQTHVPHVRPVDRGRRAPTISRQQQQQRVLLLEAGRRGVLSRLCCVVILWRLICGAPVVQDV